MKTMYCVNPNFIQTKEFEQYCFKDCGKTVFGAIHFDVDGVDVCWGFCWEKDCPFEENSIDFGQGQPAAMDEPVNIVARKLKPLNPEGVQLPLEKEVKDGMGSITQ